MNEKVVNLNIKVKNFFFKWIEITRPFHKLIPQQQQVLALLLYRHYILQNQITNKKILWKEVFDYETKKWISDELNIQMGSVENLLSKLRKSKVIKDNQIQNYYIPNIKENKFSLIFNFKLINER